MPNTQHLKTALAAQKEETPSSSVKARLMAEIQPPAQDWQQTTLRLAMGFVFIFLLVLTLFITAKPTVVSTWTNELDTQTAIYHTKHIEPADVVLTRFQVRSTKPSNLLLIFGILIIVPFWEICTSKSKNISKTLSK